MATSNRRIAHTPYEVGRIAVVPGSSPFVFHISFKPEALTAVGILEKLVHVLTEAGAPILLLKVSATKAGEVFTAILVTDLKGKEKMAKDLAQKMRQAPYVSEVQYTPPVANGVAIDTFSFPLKLMGERAVIFPRVMYEGLIKDGWARFGTPYAVLLYTVGYATGSRAYTESIKIAGKQDVGRLIKALFQTLGFGLIETITIDDVRKEAVLRIHESFECQLFPGAGEIRGNFVRGLIAGWLAGYWGVTGEFEVFAREVKCIAKGDSYCEYVARVEKRTV